MLARQIDSCTGLSGTTYVTFGEELYGELSRYRHPVERREILRAHYLIANSTASTSAGHSPTRSRDRAAKQEPVEASIHLFDER